MLQEIQKRTAVKIQAHYRGYLTRRSLRAAMQEEAVIRIQRGWRRVRAKRQAKRDKEALRSMQWKQHGAATCIQAHQRARMARKYAARERLKVRAAKENLAAREIQRVARGKSARERLRREREAAIAVERELACITIQRTHRGRQGRKVYHAMKREKAATQIQASARRKQARATVAAMKHQQMVERKAATTIQCFWRQKMAHRALERRKAAQRLEKRRAAALRIQTVWRGRVARKWLYREQKRWKKAARSLHPEVFENWFDSKDRYQQDHEDQEWKWPYEQSEEWRGNIHAAYLAGKELRNKRYALLQQRMLVAEQSRHHHSTSTARREPSGVFKKSVGGNSTTQRSDVDQSRKKQPESIANKSKQTQRVYSSVQGILRTLVQRGIFEESGMPVDTVGLRKISKQNASLGANSSLHRVMADSQTEASAVAARGSGLSGVRAVKM